MDFSKKQITGTLGEPSLKLAAVASGKNPTEGAFREWRYHTISFIAIFPSFQ
jgi:hypothetical protein